MGRDGRNYSAFVIGPNGARLTRADLPPPNLKRWVSRRKAEVVLAVEGGLITMTEACERYRLTLEEYLGWERGLTLFGVEGLKVGQSQQHRQTTRHLTDRLTRSRADVSTGAGRCSWITAPAALAGPLTSAVVLRTETATAALFTGETPRTWRRQIPLYFNCLLEFRLHGRGSAPVAKEISRTGHK